MKKSEYDAVKKDMKLTVQCLRCREILQGTHTILEHECKGKEGCLGSGKGEDKK
jgi:hypothetical protein